MKRGTIVEIDYFDFRGCILSDGKTYPFIERNLSRDISFSKLSEGDEVLFDIATSQVGNEHAHNVRPVGGKGYNAPTAGKGINQYASIFGYSEDERKIISLLADTFYVTHTNGGKPINVTASSRYKYCLVKPTQDFVHQFN